jgi:hypothetical protein
MAAARWLRVYPRWWRARYAAEVADILAEHPPDRRQQLDLLHGAIDAHLRGAGSRPVVAPIAALVAGGAWTLAAAAVLTLPTAPDWPGHVLETLPLAAIGAAAITVAQVGVARRAWAAATVAMELAVLAVIATGIVWTVTFAVATLGGPYGAITAASQALAAIASIALGLTVQRAGAHPYGTLMVVSGGCLLLSTPLAWLAVGALWTAIGAWTALATPNGEPRTGRPA